MPRQQISAAVHPLIRIEQLCKSYSLQDASGKIITNQVLFDIHLTIDHGEFVAIMGHSGSGKSTLMKIIAGNVLPDGGEIWREPELKLAWLEQAPELPDEATIYDAVASGLGELGEVILEVRVVGANGVRGGGLVACHDLDGDAVAARDVRGRRMLRAVASAPGRGWAAGADPATAAAIRDAALREAGDGNQRQPHPLRDRV